MQRLVTEVIEVIRPMVVADGGDISLVGVDASTGVVSVQLSGACVSCPSSANAMLVGIDRIVRDRVPAVTEVRAAGTDPEYTDTAVAL